MKTVYLRIWLDSPFFANKDQALAWLDGVSHTSYILLVEGSGVRLRFTI